jgi:RNA polymerase primary sigma factor
MDEASELEAAGTVKLTRHEETELAKKIEAGRKAQDALDRGTSFDPGMDSAIAEEGRNAKRFFIESNIGLVHFVAGKYWRPLKVAQNAKYAGQATKQTTSLTYDDLVQEGTLGLINALEKFDWRKGHKFSSLAWWHIRMRMQRANQNTGRSIRLPSFMHARINKIVKTRGSLMQYLSREPTIPEIAMATGMKDEDVRFAIEKDSMQTVPEDTLNWAQLRNSGATAVAMREAEMENVRGEIDGLLQELEPIQRQVLIHRFGLDNGEPRTVEKIGDVLGLSTNHVIEIQRTAMRKMRRPQKLWKVKKLTHWLNDMFE